MGTEFRNVRRWTLELDDKHFLNLAATGTGRLEWQNGISAPEYLRLYTAVGGAWNWFDRRLMPEQELRELLADGRRCVAVLRDCRGEEVGFCETLQHHPGEVEIAYFGLHSHFTGKGLGGPLLSQVVSWARQQSAGDSRIWLTTCEWDSPQALDFYQKIGFRIVHEDIVRQRVPTGFGDHS